MWWFFVCGLLVAAGMILGAALYVLIAADERARRDLSSEEDWLL